MYKRLSIFFLILFIFTSVSSAQKYIKPIDDKFIESKEFDKNGKEVYKIKIPSSPPPVGYRMKSAALTANVVIISGVPALSWSFGCTATSAAMIAGYYDRNGYDNMYSGPTNGGIFPLSNSVWGTANINGETRALCPLSATSMGLDGRVTRGHVDDYWIMYGNGEDDPYITNGWIVHTHEDCTADFMKTNQSAYGNSDGMTTYYYYPDGVKFETDVQEDGIYGLELFFNSRGYNVINRFTQTILGYDGNSIGFTFQNYMNEINANRPVMIHLSGHSMVGIGYDDDTQTIYLHDTWDYQVHSMTWGDEYDGMQHIAMSVFQLEPLEVDCHVINAFPYEEDFSDLVKPACWKVVDNIASGEVWQFDNPGSRTINTPTKSNGFAIVDSDRLGGQQDCDLISPEFDFSNETRVNVSFYHYFNNYSSDRAKFYYTIDQGALWVELEEWTTDTENPEHYTIDLTTQLAGQTNVQFKWNYTGDYSWYWAVDDFSISTDGTTIPQEIKLTNQEFTETTDTCFGAYQTIIVAGDGSVELLEGSQVSFIAGNNIKFLPGFYSYEGSQMIAYITPDSSFCDYVQQVNLVENQFEESKEPEGITTVTEKNNYEIKVYPNPSSGNFNVDISGLDIPAEISVYSVSGLRVYFNKGIETHNESIDISGIDKGVYILLVKSGLKTYSRKLIVR